MYSCPRATPSFQEPAPDRRGLGSPGTTSTLHTASGAAHHRLGRSAKNGLQFDVSDTGRTRLAEVERAVSLSARILTDRTRPDGRGWVGRADPEGNEICVERGKRG
ncbi:VOC family protein [Streptomyces sp. NPDC058735]|uniref:VOC family protein n=1 Tax=unclassified Streptomyces TaxID=2593676 RepID=UPI00367C112A